MKLLVEGTWWFKSREDPRWNEHGRGQVGGFCSFDRVPEARAAFARNRERYGDPPPDLEWGYAKD